MQIIDGKEVAASLRRESSTRLEEKAVIREIPLQDSATLETELSALQRRQLRRAAVLRGGDLP